MPNFHSIYSYLNTNVFPTTTDGYRRKICDVNSFLAMPEFTTSALKTVLKNFTIKADLDNGDINKDEAFRLKEKLIAPGVQIGVNDLIGEINTGNIEKTVAKTPGKTYHEIQIISPSFSCKEVMYSHACRISEIPHIRYGAVTTAVWYMISDFANDLPRLGELNLSPVFSFLSEFRGINFQDISWFTDLRDGRYPRLVFGKFAPVNSIYGIDSVGLIYLYSLLRFYSKYRTEYGQPKDGLSFDLIMQYPGYLYPKYNLGMAKMFTLFDLFYLSRYKDARPVLPITPDLDVTGTSGLGVYEAKLAPGRFLNFVESLKVPLDSFDLSHGYYNFTTTLDGRSISWKEFSDWLNTAKGV